MAEQSNSHAAPAPTSPVIKPPKPSDPHPEGTVIIILGVSGTGKCFGRDTPLLMFDGTVKPVQSIAPYDRLMGDDCTPRIVTPGSIVHGHAPLYRIRPHIDGAQPHIVNGAHIAVLIINKTTAVEQDDSGKFSVQRWSLDVHGLPTLLTVASFTSRNDADSNARSLDQSALIYEVSIDDVLGGKVNAAAMQRSMMYRPPIVTFDPPKQRIHQSLHAAISVDATDEQISEFVWCIGLWVTIGRRHEPVLRINTADTAIIRRCKQFASLFTLTYEQDECELRIGDERALFHRLLVELDMMRGGQIAHSLLTESLSVRSSLLAGVLDGSHICDDDDNARIVQCQSQPLIDQIIFLARSLGHQTSGVVYDKATSSYQVRLSIDGNAGVRRRMTLNYLNMKNVDLDQSIIVSWPFTVEPLDAGDYYGFTVDGNSRFLLGDLTVTHNTTLGELLATKLNCYFRDADDYHSSEAKLKMKEGHALNDKDRIPWLKHMASDILKWRTEHDRVVFACSALKRVYRAVLCGTMKAEDILNDQIHIHFQHQNNALSQLHFVLLNGTFELLKERIEKRKGHYFHADLLQSQLDTLEMPQQDEDVIVVSVEQGKDEVVQEIIQQLQAKEDATPGTLEASKSKS